MKTLQYYENNAASYINRTHNIDMSAQYAFFTKYLKNSNKILDIGFGSGRDSIYFSKEYKVTSIDPVKKFVDHGIKLGLDDLHLISAEEMSFNEEFDAIWACASLLHIKKENLNEVFRKCHLALKKSGYMYCSFKYGDFSGELDGKYYIYLTENSIIDYIQNTGFEMIEYIITDDISKRDNKWLNVILYKQPDFGGTS